MASEPLETARWLRRRAENVAALLLLAMFLCFILQIVARYVFNYPLGWTDEVSVAVLDLVHAVGRGLCPAREGRGPLRHHLQRGQRKDALRLHRDHRHSGHCAVRDSLPAVIAYVTFLKVERTAYLGIRLDYLYSIYVVFSVAVIVRYAALTWRALRGQAAGHPDRKRVGAMTSPFALSHLHASLRLACSGCRSAMR